MHVVVSTLTHTTSSIIATRPGNFGGAVPSSKTTSKTSAQATQDTSTEVKPSSTTRLQTSTTAAAKQTSTSDIELTSATSIAQTSAHDSPGKTVQQASPTSVEQASATSAQQIPSTAPQQVPSTGAEQDQTTALQQSTVHLSSAVESTESPSATLPSSTGNDGGATPETSAASSAAGSEDGTQVSSVNTIPTNGQVVTSGGYTEPQQSGATTSNEVSGPSTAPQGADASQATSPEAVQSNKPSSASGTTIAVVPVLTLGSEIITANPSSEYSISSQTLAPGGPAITVGGTTYSLAPSASAIVENGRTQSLAPAYSVSVAPQITLGSSVITANPSDGFVYASQTISAGGPAVTADGNTYSLATSGATTYVIENGVTQQPATLQTAAPVLTFENSAVTANPDSVFVVGSQTLEADGSAIVVGETTYSLATSGASTLIVQNGVTSTLAKPQGNGVGIGPSIASSAEVHVVASVLALTVTSNVVTQNAASEFVVSGQTLSPGGSAVEVEGTTYSLAPPASAILVNGVTSALPVAPTSPVVSVKTDAVAPVITVGSSVVTQDSASEYVIGTQTLAPGGSAIELQGTTYSLATSGSAVIINGVSSTILTVQSTAVVIAGQTLSQGSEIQDQGTTYSLAPSGTAIIMNGKTSALPTSTTEGSPLFAIGTTTLKPGDAVTVQGTTYSIPASDSASPVVVINGKTSTLPNTQGTGAAVLSGLQRTTNSLSGSRVTGSAPITSTQGSESASRTQGVAPTSTAGAKRSVQRGAADTVVALIMGVLGMVLF